MNSFEVISTSAAAPAPHDCLEYLPGQWRRWRLGLRSGAVVRCMAPVPHAESRIKYVVFAHAYRCGKEWRLNEGIDSEGYGYSNWVEATA